MMVSGLYKSDCWYFLHNAEEFTCTDGWKGVYQPFEGCFDYTVDTFTATKHLLIPQYLIKWSKE